MCLGYLRNSGGFFNKHHINVFFKPSNTLRQKLVHPKDCTPHTQKSKQIESNLQAWPAVLPDSHLFIIYHSTAARWRKFCLCNKPGTDILGPGTKTNEVLII